MTATSLNLSVDNRTRRAVLDYVLVLHPQQHLTIPVLIREMQAGALDFGEGPELECAIRDCVGDQLIEIEGGRLWPTQLALEAERAV
jgi:hypothetical protein